MTLRSLVVIQQEVDQESRRSRLSRLMHQDTVASMISRNMQELDDAWRRFDVSSICFVNISPTPPDDLRSSRNAEDGMYDDS